MPDRDRPNVVFLHSHNTGTFVEPFGHAVPTPNLNRLAREGILFRRAFAAAPTCSPSRAAFLTGMHAHSSGMLGLAHRGFQMEDYTRHLVHRLKANGYTTAVSGVEHTAPDTSIVGYDHILSGLDTNYHDLEQHPDSAKAAVAFIDTTDSPFSFRWDSMKHTVPIPKRNPADILQKTNGTVSRRNPFLTLPKQGLTRPISRPQQELWTRPSVRCWTLWTETDWLITRSCSASRTTACSFRGICAILPTRAWVST